MVRVVAAVGWIWMSSRSFRRSISAAATEIPLGVKSFAELVSTGFVDKTAKVAGLVVRNKSFFFSRPRRFGKSLALDTAVCMLEGKEELFTNTVSFLLVFFPFRNGRSSQGWCPLPWRADCGEELGEFPPRGVPVQKSREGCEAGLLEFTADRDQRREIQRSERVADPVEGGPY